MKSASIIKYDTGKVFMHPKRIVKDMGSYAIPPYIVDYNLDYNNIAKILLETLDLSGAGTELPKEEEELFHKENVEATGIKNMKSLHDGSLHVSVFTKDGSYHITPSINKGSRKGFHYIKDRIVIPIDSSNDQLADALKEAFEKSS